MPDIASSLHAEPWLAVGLGAIAALLIRGIFRDRRLKRKLAQKGLAFRERIYIEFHLTMWPLAALCAGLWLSSGRSLDALGFAHEEGMRLSAAWAAAGLIGGYSALTAIRSVTSAPVRDAIRQQLADKTDLSLLQPETPRQLLGFTGVSLTAGITEEVVFRGFLIGALGVFMPLPLAAALALAIFLAGHVYQGWRGVAGILPISVILTVMFVASGSLWPGIALHALVDVTGGIMLYAAGRAAPRAA